jgi:alginate O-acetyltransferase complex protein AlgI
VEPAAPSAPCPSNPEAVGFAVLAFLAFFAPVFAAYWWLKGRPRLVLLLAADYLFYAWWDLRVLWVLVAVTALHFVCGQRIDRAATPGAKRAWLVVSLAGGLGLLEWFKYHDFFAGTLVAAAAGLGWRIPPLVSGIVLPVGISYYTFQMLSYTFDIHRGVMKPTRSPLVFAVFASFFPHIIAGPITRARQLVPQLERGATFDFEHLEVGARRILIGLVKKVFVADTLAHHLVDPVFAAPAQHTAGMLALALAGYAVQVYADFSGYSSIAIGVARLLGLELPENFRFPYLATDIAQFWRRWHISLSSWLRDYLWWPLAKDIPFGGGALVRLRSLGALFAVFLLCGLWHGAAWTFVAWGGLHGAYIVVYEVWRRRREAREAAPRRPLGVAASWLVTQAAVMISWALFRAGDFGTFADFLRGLLTGCGTRVLALPPLAWVALLALPVDHAAGWLLEHRPQVRRLVPAPILAASYVAAILFLFHARVEQPDPFIYFRF